MIKLTTNADNTRIRFDGEIDYNAEGVLSKSGKSLVKATTNQKTAIDNIVHTVAINLYAAANQND